MILIEEKLPGDPLRSEVVLHVRRHLRRRLRAGQGNADDLALIFGLSSEEGGQIELRRALKSASPIGAAAKLIAEFRGTTPPVVTLGHDDDHIQRCHAWLQQRKNDESAFNGIIATDLEMLLVLSKARDYATSQTPEVPTGSDIPILIEGETGTGKELLARAIHDIWARDRPGSRGFHAVQVAGLPPDLINDELFGHTRGAFTGAHDARPGRLEEANEGTLLIDEIGDLPSAAQVRLLRFLQDQKLSRAGENQERQVRVRVLAATWHRLDDNVGRGTFRRDLLYRVRVGWLRLPPLRERLGTFTDIVPELLRRMGQRAVPPITRSAVEALALYTWPGNLRELVGILRLALNSTDGATLRLEDLPSHLQRPYFDQPLFKRAPGFLCDEADGQPLSRSLALWRVKEVVRSLDSVGPPEGAIDASALHQFFASIPDDSGEHKSVVQQLRQSVDLTREQGRLGVIETMLKRIQTAPDLPPTILEALDAEQRKLITRREATDREIVALSAATHLKDNPWFGLLTEIRQVPALAGQDPIALLQGLIPLLHLAMWLSPELIKTIKDFAREGNVLERVRQFLSQSDPALLDVAADIESDDDDPAGSSSNVEIPELPAKARDWSADHWQDLMTRFPSKAAAGRALSLDVKTISSHLQRLGIEERWTGPR